MENQENRNNVTYQLWNRFHPRLKMYQLTPRKLQKKPPDELTRPATGELVAERNGDPASR